MRLEAPAINHGITQRPALDVANFLIHQSGYTKTLLQIQEMSYIAHGYMLALRNRPLFRDNVEAWDDGPVIPSLHHAFKKGNGYSDMEISQKRTAIENVLLPETIKTHEDRLRAAGFTNIDVWFQCFNFASLVAIK